MELKRPNSIGRILSSPFVWLWDSFDLRDIFLIGGICTLCYGLYLKWGLWLSYMVGGILLALIGYLMKDKPK